jgi:hypothetical protein
MHHHEHTHHPAPTTLEPSGGPRPHPRAPQAARDRREMALFGRILTQS